MAPVIGATRQRLPRAGLPPSHETDYEAAMLEKTDLIEGTGAEAQTGHQVSVHYVGTLTNGKQFDASRDHGEPFSFTLGRGQVIRGWDEGVVGMKVGGKRKLVVPAALAYGDRGFPGLIPPGSTLVFEVELLGVR